MSGTQIRLRWLQFVLLLVVGVLLTVLAFGGVDLQLIWQDIAKANWAWIVLSVLLTLLGHLSRARRWQLLIQSAGHEAGIMACFVAMMTGYLSNLGIPRIGELGRCASLARLTKVPLMALGGTVVAERVVDLLTFVLLLLLTMGLAGEIVLDFWAEFMSRPIGLMWTWRMGVLAAVVLVGLILLGWFVWGGAGKNKRPMVERLRGWGRELWAGMWSAARARRPLEFALHTVLIWMGYYVAPLCTLLALDLGGDQVFVVAYYVFVFGSLARTLPLPAGAMGAYHYLITHLMIALGYTYSVGLATATLNHAVQTIFYLIFGLLGLLGFFILLRRVDAEVSQESHPTQNNNTPTP